MLGPKKVNSGETGYHIGDVKRWAAIGSTILAVLAGTGGVLGMKVFSQADVDKAIAHANQHLQEEMDISNIAGKVEAMDHKFADRLETLDELIVELKVVTAEIAARAEDR